MTTGIIYSIIVCIDTCGLNEGYLQYHGMHRYLWSYWGIFTVSLYILITLILLRDIYSIISKITGINTYNDTVNIFQYDHRYQYIRWYCKYPSVRSEVSIHMMILGYLQYHQPDSDKGRFDLTEGYLQYHRMYWYLWSYWEIFTVSSAWLW
jgi:hypothetical protein